MKQQTYHVISYTEVEELVKDFLGITDPYYNLIGDLGDRDPRWRNDTTHTLEVTPESEWIQPNHSRHLAEVLAKGKVERGWELQAILNELGKAGKIPQGDYLIEVCW